MSYPKFVIKTSKDEKPFFILVAPNGQTLVTSETYESKQACNDGIRAVKEYCNYTTLATIDETNQTKGEPTT